jgi:hypothetical protein
MLAALVLAATIGGWLLGLPRRWAVVGTLAWGPAAAGVLSGQNTSIALLLVVLTALALVRAEDRASSGSGVPAGRPGRWEGLAGVLVGALAYKPQLGAPLGGLLLLRGRWLAIVLAVAAVTVQYVLGIVAAGGNVAWPADWLATVGAYSVEDFRANGWQAVSPVALLARADVFLGSGSPYGPLAVVGLGLGAIVVLLALPWLGRAPVVQAVALACAAGLVVNPHAWVYDATLLLPAIGVFAASASERGWPVGDRWLLAVAYALAATWPVGGVVGFVPLLLVVAAAPLVLVRLPQIRSSAAGTPVAGAV